MKSAGIRKLMLVALVGLLLGGGVAWVVRPEQVPANFLELPKTAEGVRTAVGIRMPRHRQDALDTLFENPSEELLRIGHEVVAEPGLPDGRIDLAKVLVRYGPAPGEWAVFLRQAVRKPPHE